MKIENHHLVDEGITIQNSPNQGGVLTPDTIVIHYTAGPTAQSAIQTMMDPTKKVSAHLVVDFDGAITQLVPFNHIAWHAGKSRHKDRVGLNKFSVGIEIVNAGRLKKTGSTYVAWFGRKYPEEEVFLGVHRNENIPTFWHQYTEQQITVVEELCSLLVAEYDMQFILGHEEISPGRKIDPGPAFPLDKLRNRILRLDPRDEEGAPEPTPSHGVVTASKLNIRSGPSVAEGPVAKPIEKGTRVRILEKSGDWYRISTTIEGWVAEKFVKSD